MALPVCPPSMFSACWGLAPLVQFCWVGGGLPPSPGRFQMTWIGKPAAYALLQKFQNTPTKPPTLITRGNVVRLPLMIPFGGGGGGGKHVDGVGCSPNGVVKKLLGIVSVLAFEG